MAALAKDRNTRIKAAARSINVPVAAGVVIHNGAQVCTNAAGYAVPASDTAGLSSVRGIAENAADNSGGADGDLEVRIRKGSVELETTGASAVDQADCGRPVYVLDDQTVVKAAGTVNSIQAGVLDSIDVETGKPWVHILADA